MHRYTLGRPMMTTRKIILGAVAAVILPLAIFAVSLHRGVDAWFDNGDCICGHHSYIHLRADGYFKYSPGHGVPETRDFGLRPNGRDWDAVALRSPDWYFSPPKEGEVVARLRIQDGVLY